MSNLVVTPIKIPVEEWGVPHPPKMIDYYDKAQIKYALRAMVCCPIHRETTPSFYLEVYSHDDEPTMTIGNFHCFGCNASGNAVPSKLSEDLVGETGLACASSWDLLYKPATK